LIPGARRARVRVRLGEGGVRAHPVDAEEAIFGTEDLLGLLAELAVVLDGRSF
jgi:hypothetical protein